MNILILNFILSTAIKSEIIRRDTNHDTMIYNMARGFVNGGHSVTLLAADSFRPLKPESNSFEIIYFPSRLTKIFKPWLLPWPKGLGKYLRQNADRFDLIITVETFSIPTLIAAINCKQKLLIWQEMAFHQHFCHKIPAKFWYNCIARSFMRNVPVIPQSDQSRHFIGKYLKNILPSNIGHGADSSRFFPTDETQDAFVVVSMLVERKQIDGIIRHFARLIRNEAFQHYRLDIIGEGPQMGTLKELVGHLNIKNNVIFHGFLDHNSIAGISRKAKALLINTRQDNNMVTIPESLANGTPILTTTVPNNAKIISELNLGIAKDKWDHADLESMIINYPKFHQNCIQNRDLFTNTGTAQAIIDAYSQRINQKS